MGDPADKRDANVSTACRFLRNEPSHLIVSGLAALRYLQREFHCCEAPHSAFRALRPADINKSSERHVLAIRNGWWCYAQLVAELSDYGEDDSTVIRYPIQNWSKALEVTEDSIGAHVDAIEPDPIGAAPPKSCSPNR